MQETFDKINKMAEDTLAKKAREKCPYSELLWSAFSRIRTEYREILLISMYSVRTRENADQNNPKYEHFLSSERQKNMS